MLLDRGVKMSTSELHLCPACGKDGELRFGRNSFREDYVYIACVGCELRTRACYTNEGAFEDWNNLLFTTKEGRVEKWQKEQK
jgi:hypothetical protein